jgi:hypothetical protein
LFCLNDADYRDLNKATDMSWSAHQDEDVDWIAVFTEGRREEAEIEWEQHTLRQKPAEHGETRIWIIIKLVGAALGGLNDCPANTFLGMKLGHISCYLTESKGEFSHIESFQN